MREIITLQLGQQSNYLGTHFWNTQESYFTYGADEESPIDHDVHFRPGLGADGTETYMPRTVIYDLKGGFGTLRRINALYEVDDGSGNAPPSSGLWSGGTTVHRQNPIEASAYQTSLDTGQSPPDLSTSTVRYWSDFNRVFFHPRSVVQLNEYELGSTLMPFEKWHAGEELFASLDREHDLLDRDLRPFVEEADQMQGVQVMAGLDDAWAGFAARYLERLRDEYGKTPVWVFGVQEPVWGLSREKRLLKLVNKARALVELNSQASLVIPLALPETALPSSVRLDSSSPWHVSALLAAAIESTTLYTRLKTSDRLYSSTLGNMTDLLNVFGKQTIANIEMSPVVVDESPTSHRDGCHPQTRSNGRHVTNGRGESAGEQDEEDGLGSEEGGDVALDIDLSSPQDLLLDPGNRSRRRGGRGRKRHVFSQVRAYRGPEGNDDNDSASTNGDALGGTMRHGASRRQERPKYHDYRSRLPFPLLDSYPAIFPLSAQSSTETPPPPPKKTAIRTTLTTDSSVTDKVRALRHATIRYLGVEDRETIGNELAEIAEGYREGWDSGSDEGDDDD